MRTLAHKERGWGGGGKEEGRERERGREGGRERERKREKLWCLSLLIRTPVLSEYSSTMSFNLHLSCKGSVSK
jgi:hypothetical protein